MAETEKRKYRICFTGHRPEKLSQSENEIKNDLEKEIQKAIAEGFNVFITGMARGVDIWAAQIVLKLRNEQNNIKLICAIPYKGFEKAWNDEWIKQYNQVLQQADLIKYINPRYSQSCFQARNEWMVDHSAKVIAVFNGENSGTKNTINYANKVGVPVVYVNS